jgi:hypothetical protein
MASLQKCKFSFSMGRPILGLKEAFI